MNFMTKRLGLSDLDALVTSLTPAQLISIHDRRIGVSAPGNAFQSWQSYYNPSASTLVTYQGSGTQPTVTSGTSPVTFSAGGAAVASPGGNTLYPITGPFTMYVVIAVPALSTNNDLHCIVGTTAAHRTAVGLDASSIYRAAAGDVPTAISSLVTASATIVVVKVSNSGVLGTVRVLNQAAVNTGAIVSSASNARLVFGSSGAGAASAHPSVLYACICMNVVASGANDTAVMTWATANHNAVAQ